MNNTFHISIFLLIACAVIFGLHFYIWARLVRDTGLKNPWRFGATAILVFFAFLIPAGMIFSHAPFRYAVTPLLWVIYTWLGASFLCAFLLAAVDLLQLLTLTIPLAIQRKPFNPERRQFLAMITGAVVLLADLSLSVLSLWNATAEAVQVKRVKVKLSKLPASLDGYRIVQISDVHVGATIKDEFVQTIVREMNGLKPDLIAITGDLVDGTVAQLQAQIKSLGDLKAKDVVWSVAGLVMLMIPAIGSVYPVPPAPYNWLPYLYLGYLVAGVAWFLIAKRHASDLTR